MKNASAPISRSTFCTLLLMLVLSISSSAQKLTFTISMEKPSSHYYQITTRCEGVNKSTLDFKMPVWSPGYYWIQNYPKNVVNFRATDGNGKPLVWEKTTKNSWRIKTGQAKTVVLQYQVYAFARSVADAFLDEGRGFIVPTALLMHLADQLQMPSTIAIQPYQDWKISTGLEPVKGQPNTFYAANFDELYDCPIYLGNQEVLSFEVKGIPHYVAFENPKAFNLDQFVADLQKMVETASSLIGDIPYKHYTFLIMGPGGGGLEHRNSTAVFSSNTVYNPSNEASYKRWLSFLAHEYFHLYNIKAIRPIALGPFDYDKENYTNMLWFSEGVSAYYQDIIINRAGLQTQEETLEKFRGCIRNYENIPGHLFQSATQSSMDTWIQFFNRSENASNTTISYYDKGCALGVLLDLKIRHETKNQKSLDDVMRALYQQFYKEKKRGFTDEEFWQVCEKIAGTSLSELMIDASTVQAIDYPKYFGYAGLEMDTVAQPIPGGWLGASIPARGNDLTISSIEWDSPAYHAGLSAQDEILEIDEAKASAEAFREMLKNKQPGDKVKFKLSYRNETREVEVTLRQKTERNFHITPIKNPSSLQAAILKSWLKA